MSSSTKRKPQDTPFQHSPDCKFSNVQPAWSFLPGSGGQWERACRCHREAVTVLDEVLDPNSAAAEPSWEAHEHGPSCEATKVQQVVKTERRDGSAGWRTTCLSCGWISIYYWQPDRVDAKGKPVIREGSVRYVYPLKRGSGTAAA